MHTSCLGPQPDSRESCGAGGMLLRIKTKSTCAVLRSKNSHEICYKVETRRKLSWVWGRAGPGFLVRPAPDSTRPIPAQGQTIAPGSGPLPRICPLWRDILWDLRFFRMARGKAKFCMACPLSNAPLSFPMAWQNFGPAVCHRSPNRATSRVPGPAGSRAMRRVGWREKENHMHRAT